MPRKHTPHTATLHTSMRYAQGLCYALCVFAVCSFALSQTAPASPEELGYLEHNVQRSLEPAGNIYSISDDGRYILSSSLWAELTLWDADSGEVIGLYHGHTSSEFGEAVTMGIGSGKAMVVGDGLIVSQAVSQGFSYDYSLQLYNPATQETQREHPQSSCFDMLVLQENILVACEGQLELWTVENQQLVQQAVQARPNPERPWPYLVADPSSAGFALIEEPSPQFPDDPLVVSFWTLAPLQLQESYQGDSADLGSNIRITPDGNMASLARNHDQDRLELLLTPRDLSQPERIPLALAASSYSAMPAISPDAAYVVADFSFSFAEHPRAHASLFEVATGRYLVTGMEPLFSETYSWLWPSQDRILWSGFTTTFPHPRIELWRLGETEDRSDYADYPLMASGASDWDNLLRRGDLDNIGEIFGVSWPETVQLYDQDVEQLLTRLLQPFTEEASLEFGRDDLVELELFPSEGTIMRAEATFPVLDDSVVAMRYAFSLRRLPLRSGAVWGIQETYRQYQCGRGDLANQWVDGVNTLCP